MKNLFWDRKITIDQVKDILKDPDHSQFIEVTALLLSRTNEIKKVFSEFLDKRVFCENWRRIKAKMRKNKWSDERIILWDEVYKVLSKDLGIKESRKETTHRHFETYRVGKAIKEGRAKRGWNQKELARRAGVSQQLISFMERGSLNFSFETLMKVTSVLDLRFMIKSKEHDLSGNITETSAKGGAIRHHDMI